MVQGARGMQKESMTEEEVYYKLGDVARLLKNTVSKEEILSIPLVLLSYKRFDDLLTADNNAYIRIPERCRWKNLLKSSSNYFKLIDTNLKKISKINPCLEGISKIFKLAHTDKLIPIDIQKQIIDIFTNISLLEEDISAQEINTIVLSHIASWEGIIEPTDYTINELLIKLLEPKDGDYFYMPFCGYGDSLIALMDYLEDSGIDAAPDSSENITPSVKVYGKDKEKYYDISALRLALGNSKTKILYKEDPFEKTSEAKQKPTVILIDSYDRFPPLKGRASYEYEGQKFIIPKKCTDLYYLLKSLNILDKKGRLVFFISPKVLSEKSTRNFIKFLVERDYLEAVVKMNLERNNKEDFYDIPLIIVNKNKDLHRKGKVAFIKHSEDDYLALQINRIFQTYRTFKTEDKNELIATIEDIKLFSYDLSPEFYKANLADTISLYDRDNLTFVELEELIEEIKEDERRIPDALFEFYGYYDYKDLSSDISNPHIVESKQVVPSRYAEKFKLLLKKCILLSFEELKRLFYNLPAKLPTIFDPEKLRQDKKQVSEKDIGYLQKGLTPLIPKEKKVICEYLYYTLFTPYVYDQLSACENIESLKKIRVPIYKSLKRQEKFLPTLKRRIEELEEERQKTLKAKVEKKEAEFKIISHLAHSLNPKIGNVESILAHLEDFLNRKGLDSELLQEIFYKGQKGIIVKDKISEAINELKQMNKLIRDTRELVTKKYGDKYFRLVNLKELFSKHILAKYEGQNLRFNFECSDNIKASLHESSFIEAFDNIIKNAVVHGFKNRKTGNEISFWIDDLGDKIIIDYANNGLPFPSGITKEEFLEFGVKDISSNGTGLGGAFVKLFIDAHEADFEIIKKQLRTKQPLADRYELKHGTYFRFTILQNRRHYGQEK